MNGIVINPVIITVIGTMFIPIGEAKQDQRKEIAIRKLVERLRLIRIGDDMFRDETDTLRSSKGDGAIYTHLSKLKPFPR